MKWQNDRCDRAYCFKLSFQNRESDLTIFYNSNNLFTSFALDQCTYERVKRKGYSIGIFFDLDKSLFAKSFLDLKNFHTNSLDIKNQYSGILPQHKGIIECDFSEKIVCNSTKVTWDRFPQENSLTINLFRLSLYEQDFFYVLTQRQVIDNILGKKLVRTSAYQIETEISRKYLSSASKKYNTSQVIEKQNCEDAMRSLFADDKKKNTKQIERCGLL